MDAHARVIIIGAGIVGCSAAYHLAQLGWRDIVVLEQGPLFATGGSTSHAPGLMFQLNVSRTMTELARYSRDLYSGLDGVDGPAFHGVGSLEVASTPERWEELKRKEGHSRSWGLPAALVGADELRRLVPIMRVDHLYGALHVPSDGTAPAVRVAERLAAAAVERGAATFHAHAPVTGVEVRDGRVRAVHTPQGRMMADAVLLCAGIWGPRVGRMAGVPVPLTPVQHQYARTAPLAALAGETREIVHPIVRHQDKAMYFRQHGERYGIGSYYHEPILTPSEAIRPHAAHGPMPSIEPFTPGDFAPAREAAAELFPVLRDVPLEAALNGMFSFTPDGGSLLGESPDVRGFWVAEAIWVTHAGGAGKTIAEWMVQGVPGIDVREMDLNRFHRHAATPSYTRVRGAQQYREVYDIIHPLQQLEAPRPLRVSPFYQRQRELGAEFFEGAGWERPHWFAANEHLLAAENGQAGGRTGWAARGWSPLIAAEHRAARERVALFDLTPFTKVEVSGPGALAFLQELAANEMDRPVGRVTYTSLLDHRGRIQVDLTVTRLAEQRFLAIVGGGTGMRDLAWLRLHLPADGSVQLHDVTSALCCLGVWGPRARTMVQRVCEDDLSATALPYFTARSIAIGAVPAFAVAVSYVGESGFEIYAPTEYGLALWDTLWAAGRDLGLTAAGGGAFDSLRLEKGYRLWGADIHTDYDPFEAGLGFAVKLRKPAFVGREALLRLRQEGLARKLCCLVFDDPCVVVMGKEPILDGERVLGYVTSANYGYTVGQSIAYGYLPLDHVTVGTAVEVQCFGRRYPARVAREPLYDPEGARVRI